PGQQRRILEGGGEAQANHQLIRVEVVHVRRDIAVQRRFFPGDATGEHEAVVEVEFNADTRNEGILELQHTLVLDGVAFELFLKVGPHLELTGEAEAGTAEVVLDADGVDVRLVAFNHVTHANRQTVGNQPRYHRGG